ncbi:MAG: protein tyrosine phosphatase [Myxococcaceae bacterium]|nr:protein tyrosine phosphatase [Myxococcaceae bacterium]
MVDLHCHLLYGVDDGAWTLEDSLEMARALIDLGFTAVAPSPHNRPEYAPREVAEARLEEVRQALAERGLSLELWRNSENYFLDDRFLPSLGTPEARPIGAGRYVLVEAPYTSPLPALTEIIFRIKLKGITPVIAHPERCMEFEKKGRAAEAVRAGALLQLDIGALIGRYGPSAKKVARSLLDDGLYAIGATDLHGAVTARDWVGRSLAELRSRVGERAFTQLMRETPRRILDGQSVES